MIDFLDQMIVMRMGDAGGLILTMKCGNLIQDGPIGTENYCILTGSLTALFKFLFNRKWRKDK
jgi:hypothetical protein